jgi:hypothetical protein
MADLLPGRVLFGGDHVEPNGWVKLWRKARYDQKVKALSDSAFRLWVNLLMMASTDHKTAGQLLNEATGEALSLRAIANDVGLARSVVERGLKQLCDLGMCERRPLPFNCQGYLYRIPKFGQYQPVANCPAGGTPVPQEGQSDEGGVPQTVPETVPVAGRFAGQRGVPQEGQLPLIDTANAERTASEDCPAGGTEPSGRSREVEKTSTTTPYAPSSDAEDAVPPKPKRQRRKADAGDTPREEDADQKFIRKAFERLTSTGLPTGSLKQYGTVRDWVRKRGYELAAEWVDQHEQRGKPMPVGTDPWTWFATNMAEALRKPWTWKPGWKP